MNPGEVCAANRGCHMTATRALISFSAANIAHIIHLYKSDDVSDSLQTEYESQFRANAA